MLKIKKQFDARPVGTDMSHLEDSIAKELIKKGFVEDSDSDVTKKNNKK